VDYAKEFAERIVGVSAGRIVFDGPPEKLTEEILQKIYPDGEEEDDVEDELTNAVHPGSSPRQAALAEEI
jgi:phosphonate transport system ATP-binding protein